MASEWPSMRLGDVLNLKRGYDLPAQSRKAGAVPIVSSSGVSGQHGEAKVAGPGVVTGRYGTIGQVHYVEGHFWPLNTTLYVQDFKGNNRRFIKYLLETIDYNQYSDKAAVPGVNRNHLHEAVVRLPTLPEQDGIAGYLSLLEDRIDLLRQTNATLEAIAQALFKSWFVDFDPVRAKAEGREPEGMDAETAELFPSEFEESELGLIPRGWAVGTLASLAEQTKGSINPIRSPEFEFSHYSLPAFDGGMMPMIELGSAIKSNKTPVPSGAVLISKLNPHIPRIWFVGDAAPSAVCSTEFLVWVPRRTVGSSYLYCLASSEEFNSSMRQLVTGTSNSHQRVKPDHLASLPVVIPSTSAAAAFENLGLPLMKRSGANRILAASLAKLRDTLLPRLLSGKLRLPEAESIIEESLA